MFKKVAYIFMVLCFIISIFECTKEIETLRHEVQLQKRYILDIQDTCRMYENEINELYNYIDNMEATNE